MPIEIDAPEGYGYENIDCNLSESSFTDQTLKGLNICLDDIVLGYGDHKGKRALREIITAGTGLSSDDVLITPGAAAALFMVATSMIEKADHVVVAKSNYATNIETPRAIGADVSFLNLQFETGYKIDTDELDRLIGPQTKLVSLTCPHNPTGAMIDEETLKKIICIIERKNTWLLLDETYREMSFIGTMPIAASLSGRVISVGSMSKSFGLPGIRIGWIICQDKGLMATMLAAKEQILITNSLIDEEIAFQYLVNKEKNFAPVRETIKTNFLELKKFMGNQTVLEWVEPHGGCVSFPRIKKEIQIDTALFHEHLLNKFSTYVGRGHWFEEDGRYMRIGYSWDKTEKLIKGMNNILQAIDEIRK